MSEDPVETRRIRPVRPASAGPVAVRVVAITGTGAALLGVADLTVGRSGPSEIPSHFGATGAVNGMLPPETLLATALATLVGLSFVLGLLLVWLRRSASLWHEHRTRFDRPVLTLLALFAIVSIPGTFTLELLAAEGRWPGGPGTLGPALVVLGLLPIAGLAGVSLLSTPARRASPSAPEREGGLTLSCSACAGAFQVARYPWLAPHMGFGGHGSLYLRCPRCGERGWQTVVGRAAPPRS